MGIDYSNLAKCASIASRYELLLRSKTLSFKHHQIAAPLDDRLNGSRARGGEVE
ncbi:hypothetical protein M1N47_03650 [Dehalococcoidia bacterium]|nr:hypothetical protein [Dehalococcoidia bacterium]